MLVADRSIGEPNSHAALRGIPQPMYNTRLYRNRLI
jgi:hypothetical protein